MAEDKKGAFGTCKPHIHASNVRQKPDGAPIATICTDTREDNDFLFLTLETILHTYS